MGRVFICGPPDSACWYGVTRIADRHRWEDDGTPGPWEHGAGPLCVACGLPRGTYEWEQASANHRLETGHRLGTGACADACGPVLALYPNPAYPDPGLREAQP